MALQTNGIFVAPPDNRLEPGSVNILPAELPLTDFPSTFDEAQVSRQFIEVFNKYLKDQDYKGLATSLFPDNGSWRDHLCLSWDFRTLTGPPAISKFLDTCGRRLIGITLDDSTPQRTPQVAQLDAAGKSKYILFFVKVDTEVGPGQGVVRLVHKDSTGWEALAFYTVLQELKGFEEARGFRRPRGAHQGSFAAQNWKERRAADGNFENSDPTVLIIGRQTPLLVFDQY